MKHAVRAHPLRRHRWRGMSGIAEVLHNLGYAVSGSDLGESADHRSGSAQLRHPRLVGHAADNIAGADAVVTSSAVQLRQPRGARRARAPHPGRPARRDARPS